MNIGPSILGILLSMAATNTSAQQQSFIIVGNMQGADGKFIYLNYSVDKGYIRDSALVKKEGFKFKGLLNGMTQGIIYMGKPGELGSSEKSLAVALAPSNMKISINYDKFNEGTLTGSPAQDEMNLLNDAKEALVAQLKPIMDNYYKSLAELNKARADKKDNAIITAYQEKLEDYKKEMEPFQSRLKKIDLEFIDRYPNGFATATILTTRIASMQLGEGFARYEKLLPEVKHSQPGKLIKGQLDRAKNGSPESVATNFNVDDIEGSKLSLSDYKGKYVLLDFWASWCVPCRKGNPHLVSLYNKYKEKGFEIIGVASDDGNDEAWRKAVKEDSIDIWKHVMRGYNGRNTYGPNSNRMDILLEYGIFTLPTKILIDPKGVIVGRYGGGAENDSNLDKKLSQIFVL